MARWILVVLAVGLIAASAPGGYAQYLFLDVNNDAVSSATDRLADGRVNSVDVWLQTDKNRDGSDIQVGTQREALSIFGYELVLKAVGGAVTWGEFTNLLPDREYSYERQESPTELQVGHFGSKPLGPGRYKIARFTVTVASGDPRIEFATHGTVRRGGLTALGSPSLGKDGDHYLKFTADRSRLRNTILEEPGDWADSDGLDAPGAAAQNSATLPVMSDPVLKFGASVINAGSIPSLMVTTTREGHIQVRLYDVRGRLANAALDLVAAPAGVHRVDLTRKGAGAGGLASGIYFFRVQAAEGVLQGRFVVLK